VVLAERQALGGRCDAVLPGRHLPSIDLDGDRPG
jgi:hypothetical protein